MQSQNETLLIALAALLGLFVLAALVRLLRACRHANEVDWGAGWKNLIDGLVRLLCRRYHRLDAGHIALPENGPAILVSNHVSGLDPLLMIAASRRPLRFMIAEEEYRRFGLTWLFRAAGCIPVDRDRRPQRAYRAALRALAAGEVVALFPHGKIHLDDAPPRPLKSGVYFLSVRSGAPIYPLRVEGIAGQGHTVAAVWMRSHARIHSLPPLWCQGELAGRHACLEALARRLETPLGTRAERPGQ